MMAMPTPEAYRAAVQHGANFGMPVLQKWPVARDPETQRPLMWPGAFGVVFRMDCPGGAARAIKCFTAAHSTRAKRYSAIAGYLDRLLNRNARSSSYLAECCYARKGIRVNRRWQPLLMMAWAEGEPINRYVGRLCGQPGPAQPLRALALRWLELALALRADNVAHGDLQHGNVLVPPDGGLKLIDYDGMCVPSLAGRFVVEGGHPNYQHPGRSVYFNDRLDGFSALVILTALLAAAARPDLWARFNQKNNMLFLESDFHAPDESPLFQELDRIEEPNVVHLARALKRACLTRSFASLPSFETVAAPLEF